MTASYNKEGADGLYESHLEETKRLLLIEAKKVIQNDKDFKLLKTPLAERKYKANNITLFSYIYQLVDKRRATFEALCDDKEVRIKYRSEVIRLLSDIIMRNI
jgi:hypothetical protein